MEQVQCVVVGAGVVGLAVARALAITGREVIVIERERAIGQGVSSRNSEVIHAGLYYTPGSLKARLCVQGKAMLYEFCASHQVPHARLGKLVVACDEGDLAGLEAVAATAATNGVAVNWLTQAQMQAREPELAGVAALESPSTGIVDSHALMLALQGDLERAGGVVALATRVTGLEPRANGEWIVRTDCAGRAGEVGELLAKEVINCAALGACELGRATQGLGAQHVPTEGFGKGSYFALSGKSPFKQLIYPVQTAQKGAWLGIHLTLDLGGQAKFGPDLEWLDITHESQIDYTTEAARAQVCYSAVRRYWPGLPDGALVPSYSGVRPKIHRQNQVAPDFNIQGPEIHGLSGLVNLFGIESPGLTSCLAIGEHVSSLLD